MSYQQLRCDSDSDDINFDGKSVEEAGPSTSTSASTSLCRPPSKRQKVSRRLPVDFDSTTEEEQEDDVDFQTTESVATPRSEPSTPTELNQSRIRTNNDTPVHSKALRSMLKTVLDQQTEILERLKRIERREEERESKKDEQIYVPLSVRIAVRDGYSDGVKRGFSWTFEKKKPLGK